MPGVLIWMAQGTAVMAVLMFVLWLAHFPLRNAAIVEAGWAFGLALLALIYATHAVGYWRRTVFLLPMALTWGLRLGVFILLTRGNEPEEGRYADLRQKWGASAGFNFLLYFEAYALLAGLLSLPFALAMHDPNTGLSELENLGGVICAVAFLGEILSDVQLARFKRNPKNKGRVCNVGLWRYSRHPNYFLDWLTWMSFAIVACSAQYGYLAFLSPALMLFLLLRVTGIPVSEGLALEKLGEAYRKYQHATSAFIPWFPNYR
jgi:steroid 5-alpha reductase family enzyme